MCKLDETVVIILNYNTWQQTLKLVDDLYLIYNHSGLQIIVIDNHSSNDSYNELMKKCNDRFMLILSPENNGYAAGNNIGLKMAVELGYRYSLILNNDVEINDYDFIEKLFNVFHQNNNIAVVSPDVYSPEGYLFNRYSKRPSFFDLTLGAYLYKSIGRSLKTGDGKTWGYVYRPQGCCMMVDNLIMVEIGYMDEYTFLYREEDILAEKLMIWGYRCACCINTSVVHNHSYTVKNYTSKKHQIKHTLRSYKYYLTKYRHYNFIKRDICLLFNIIKNTIMEQ